MLHAGLVTYDPAEAVALSKHLTDAPHGWEMFVRINQSLELTDALWELVPKVVAAGEAEDQMSPAEIADQSAAGQRLGAAAVPRRGPSASSS
jgi:hypothetical protein